MTALLQMEDVVPSPVDRTTILFGEWLPDHLTLNNPGAIEALNVIPAENNTYAPFCQHVPQQYANLNEMARGAAIAMLPNDVVQVYAGTVKGPYSRIADGVGFGFLQTILTSEENSYKFVRVNEQMVLIHPEIPLMRSPIGVVTPFATVGGTPPTASCGAQVGDFLMVGNLTKDPDDFNGFFPHRVRWSGFNNIDLPWVSSPVTQADFQDMPQEGGPVVAISGRTYGTIYQAKMISRATYRGPPNIFDIVTVEDKRGAIARDSIIDVGPYQFFIAEDGFFVWNGTNSSPIGDGRVNKYFFNKLHYAMRSRICGAADLANGCVMWAYPTDITGTLNEIIIYSYKENKFSHSIQVVEYLFDSGVTSIPLDSMSAVSSVDAMPAPWAVSWDDSIFRSGGRHRVGAFNDEHYFGLFTGLPMRAIMDTGEFSGPEGERVFVNNARPLVDVAAPLVGMRVAMRDQIIGAPAIFSSLVTQEADGQCPIIEDARYMRFRVDIPADTAWTHAAGVEIARAAAGEF